MNEEAASATATATATEKQLIEGMNSPFTSLFDRVQNIQRLVS